MTKEFQALLVREFVDDARISDYVAWAESELLAGRDGPNLRILAGWIESWSRWDLERHFDAALEELGMEGPNPEIVTRDYVREVAQRVMQGEIKPSEAVSQLWLLRAALSNGTHLNAQLRAILEEVEWIKELNHDAVQILTFDEAEQQLYHAFRVFLNQS